MSKKHAIHILSKLVVSKGFILTQGRLVKIKSDISFVISLECPSALIYPTAYILPLYIPSQYHYLSYGCRLNYLPDSRVVPLLRNADPEETEEWVIEVFTALERFVFPFWESISSASNLKEHLTSHKDPSLFQCDLVQKERLLIYTCIYLHDRNTALCRIEQLQKTASMVTYFSDRAKDALRSELIALQTLLLGDLEILDSFIASTLTATLQSCFPKWKK